MIHGYVPFEAMTWHDDSLAVGKWYIPTYKHGEYFGPYDTQEIANKALPGVQAQQKIVCQTCED